MAGATEGFWSEYSKNHFDKASGEKAPNYRVSLDLLFSCRNCRSLDWDGLCTRYNFYAQGYYQGDDALSFHVCDAIDNGKKKFNEQ